MVGGIEDFVRKKIDVSDELRCGRNRVKDRGPRCVSEGARWDVGSGRASERLLLKI